MTKPSRFMINVTLSAFVRGEFPGVDVEYANYVTEYLRANYPHADFGVSTAQGLTRVFVYREGRPDDTLAAELTKLFGTDLWSTFCEDRL